MGNQTKQLASLSDLQKVGFITPSSNTALEPMTFLKRATTMRPGELQDSWIWEAPESAPHPVLPTAEGPYDQESFV